MDIDLRLIVAVWNKLENKTILNLLLLSFVIWLSLQIVQMLKFKGSIMLITNSDIKFILFS